MAGGFVGLDTTLQVKTTTAGALANVGRVESAEGDAPQSYEHLTGAGGEDSGVYSMNEPQGNASMWMQGLFPLNMGKTVVNGLPVEIPEIQGGVLGDKVFKQTSCYLANDEISLEKGGAVKCDFDWLSLTHTTGDITTAATALAKNLILAWHTGDIKLGGVGFACQSIKIKREHGIKLDTDIDAKTGGVERMPTVVKPGNQKVTVDIDFGAAPTVDVYKTDPGTVQLVFKATNTETSPKTLTVTVSNIKPVGLPIPIAAGEDEIVYKFTGELDYNDLASYTATLA